jgi:hypothetical protein
VRLLALLPEFLVCELLFENVPCLGYEVLVEALLLQAFFIRVAENLDLSQIGFGSGVPTSRARVGLRSDSEDLLDVMQLAEDVALC